MDEALMSKHQYKLVDGLLRDLDSWIDSRCAELLGRRSESALTFLQSSGVLWSKSVAPLTNRFIRNPDSTLSQEIFDIPKTETELMV